MQQTSDARSSTMSLIPSELLSMILLHTMRSRTPVHLERFLQLGRQFQNIRQGNDPQNPGTDSSVVENSFPESNAFACSERWFLSQLHDEQIEHFQDWLLINSTCRRFRALGKRAFFSEKTFIIRPVFLNYFCRETTKGNSAENIAIARVSIRHVIAAFSFHSLESQFIGLPRYHTLQRLRSLSIQISGHGVGIPSRLALPIFQRYSLPKKLSSLLQELGLRVDQLEMDVQHDDIWNARQRQSELLVNNVYPFLQMYFAWKARGKLRGSDEIQPLQ